MAWGMRKKRTLGSVHDVIGRALDAIGPRKVAADARPGARRAGRSDGAVSGRERRGGLALFGGLLDGDLNLAERTAVARDIDEAVDALVALRAAVMAQSPVAGAP